MTPPSSSPPRPIQGCIGSRIRIILGNTGNEWLLLLNHEEDDDDGNQQQQQQWQEQLWNDIPQQVIKQLKNCERKGRYCREIDYSRIGSNRTTSAAWFMNGIKWDKTGEHTWWENLEDDAGSHIQETNDYIKASIGDKNGSLSVCLIDGRNGFFIDNVKKELNQRIRRLNRRNKEIKMVRLFSDGAYYIKDEEGSEWKGINLFCSRELEKPGTVNDLACARDGSWVIIRPGTYECSNGIDATLQSALEEFYRKQRERMQRRSREIQQYHQAAREEQRQLRELQEALARAAEEAAREEEEEERRRLSEQLQETMARELQQAAREEEQRRLRVEEEQRLSREESEAEILFAEMEGRHLFEVSEQTDSEQVRMREGEAAELKKKIAEADQVERLQSQLIDRLMQEKMSIKELESHIEKLGCHLRERKKSLRASIDSLPDEQRAFFPTEDDKEKAKDKESGNGACVICQDSEAVRAVVPCGHLCLCNDCAFSLAIGRDEYRICPLCRGNIDSTLKIFSQKVLK